MKTEIKILGTGCAKCNTLAELTEQVVRERQNEIIIRKIGDIDEILSYRIFSTPALVINERLLVSGRVPTKDELRDLIDKALSE